MYVNIHVKCISKMYKLHRSKRSITEGVPAEAGQTCVLCESVGAEYKIRRTNIFVYGGKRVKKQRHFLL